MSGHNSQNVYYWVFVMEEIMNLISSIPTDGSSYWGKGMGRGGGGGGIGMDGR